MLKTLRIIRTSLGIIYVVVCIGGVIKTFKNIDKSFQDYNEKKSKKRNRKEEIVIEFID